MEEIVVTLAIAFVLVILVVLPLPARLARNADSHPQPAGILLYRSPRDVNRWHVPMHVPKAGADRTTETPACGANRDYFSGGRRAWFVSSIRRI
jgi:hypothetical protein